jgi:hypothetical protein
MSKLTHIQRFRFTQNDMLLFSELKIERELPKLIEAENKRNEKIRCPF